ncbi:MAG: class I SAM-dependent methyltransferase [Actinomycetota bacterium]
MADEQATQANRAWSWRAADWATLFEPFNIAVFRDVLDRLQPTSGTTLVDIACGSGLALTEAARRGAGVAGIDAADGLVRVARERLPDADLHTGDMCDLPWADESFDLATSYNGVWDVEGAMVEMRRVLRPGGRFGISSWGDMATNDLVTVLAPAMLAHAPPEVLESGMALSATGEPGVFEQLCADNGLTVTERGTTDTVFEFADPTICARACIATGPLWAAADQGGEAAVMALLEEAAAPFASPTTGIIRLRFGWSWVIGERAERSAPISLP